MSQDRLILIMLIVFVMMGLEAARAARNERRQRARGGIEPPGDVYSVMRLAYPLAFAVMGIEGWWRGAHGYAAWAGAVVFGTAKALKWWAIVALGDCWTFRVVVVPGATRIHAGPYRWLTHPNYIGVIGELIGVAWWVHAPVSGPIVVAGFGLLILARLRVERRALAELY